MDLIRDCFSLHRAYPGSALTIGNFDGVHVGHQRILAEVVRTAREAGSQAVVFTFDPHPDAILHPDRAPGRILGFQRKLTLLEGAGIDAVICPDEPKAVLAMRAEEFVRRVIAEGVGAAVVVEGPNFVFGRGGGGNDALLRRMGEEAGFDVRVVAAVVMDGAEISSTRIRQAVRQGRMTEAAALLGRPFEFVGQVVHGRHRGHGLGFPTVNLEGEFLVPADGVYVGRAVLPEGTYGAAISIGLASTFGDLRQAVVEAYLLDFDREVYGRYVRLEVLDRIRDQEAFDSAEALSRQIGRDCEAVRARLAAWQEGVRPEDGGGC